MSKNANTNKEQVAFDTQLSEEVPVVPKFSDNIGGEWVPYTSLGKEYGDKLMSLYYESALNNTIIRSKSRQISGEGFVAEDGSDITDLLDSLGYGEDTLNDILPKIAMDLVISGGAYIAPSLSADWKDISIQHLGFNKVRVSPVDNKGKIPGVFFNFDWSKNTQHLDMIPMYSIKGNRNKVAEFKAYTDSISNGTGENIIGAPTGKRTQVSFIREYSPDGFYYPAPSYSGAINSIEADIQADTYGKNSLANGMDPGMIVNFNTLPNATVRKKITEGFTTSYTGAKNAGKPVVTFTAEGTTAPKIEQMKAPDVDKRYTAINDNSQQKILSAHGVTHPSLVGIASTNSLGSGNEMAEAQELFHNTAIAPLQRLICDSLNKILKPYNVPTLKIKPIKLVRTKLSETTLVQILTKEELRELAGYEPLNENNNIASVTAVKSTVAPEEEIKEEL